jgi:lysyl-tRNA synthetase class 2
MEKKELINSTDEYLVRQKKVSDLKKKNIDCWPNFSDSYTEISQLINTEISESAYTITGRITGIREHGKSIFITVHDSQKNKMQAYIKQNEENKHIFELIQKYFDIGDIIELSGNLFFTKTNEKTLNIQNTKILSKCLHGMPSKYVGFENIEARYRQRYLDLLVNDEVKAVFEKRTKIIKEIRKILDENNYLEVETPMLHPIVGGAAAKPFKTHHNALSSDFFLRIAPELYLKRLVVGGFERVYEINKNFRNEGVSIRHNPEFTMLEFYTAYKNYEWAMEFVEDMLRKICFITNQEYVSTWNEHTIDFSKSFDRLTPKEAVLTYGNFTEEELEEKRIDQTLKERNVSYASTLSYHQKIFILFEEFAEKKLIKPTFLINFPIELSPLTKRDPKNPTIAPRFELFICGMEMSNGYNELNDPFDQAMRFKDQVKEKEAGNEEAMYYDDEFITALEYALPPTVGVGIGIDRITMIMTGAKSIKDVILFPTMKKMN